MQKTIIPPTNIRVSILATEFFDLHPGVKKICGTSLNYAHHGIDREIIKADYDQEEKKLSISTKLKREHKKAAFAAIKDNSAFQELFYEFEQVLFSFELEMEREERKHTLSYSPISQEFYTQHNNIFSNKHQAILSYYQVFAEEIKQDLALAEQCLNFVLREKVQIILAAPVYKKIVENEIPPIGQWQLDINAVVGGTYQAANQSLKVLIELSDSESIPAYIPGGYVREFLEKGLCPLLLPADTDWYIEVTAPPLQEKESSLQEIGCGYLDINTVVW